MTTKSIGPGFKIKGNKIEKVACFHNASAAIQARKSKKVRAVPRGKITNAR